MKCIHCGTDTRGKDRASNGGRCEGCRHPFAFEPLKDPLRVTDGQFHAAVQRVSPDGSVAFTDRQLWYELNRKWMRPAFWGSSFPWLALGVGPVAGAAATLLSLPVKPVPFSVAAAVVGLGLAACLHRLGRKRAPVAQPPRLAFDRFRGEYLGKWLAVHGPVRGLVEPRPASPAAQLPSIAADVSAFSFDRAVVTDRWDVAAMLVANRFHFEHNCAVLSLDGYPESIGETVKNMLRRNKQLTVFALHDASPGGCMLPLDLRGADWFPEPTVRVVDLGLRPETAQRLHLPVVQNAPVRDLPPRLAEVLPPDDLAWLRAGHVAELASLRPAQVLRAAYDGIRRVGHPGDPAAGSGTDSGPDFGYGYPGVIWVGDFHDGSRDTASVDGFG